MWLGHLNNLLQDVQNATNLIRIHTSKHKSKVWNEDMTGRVVLV